MPKLRIFQLLLAGTAAIATSAAAQAQNFDIPSGSLESALDAYSNQAGVPIMVPNAAVKGIQSHGLKGEMPAPEALNRLLKGTGFSANRDASGVIAITRAQSSHVDLVEPLQLAQATTSHAAVETVTVTSSKLGGADVQSIPIAITAMSQEQLTSTQTAGGPDLVKQVPNLTFSKTNFSGYNIQIRGIGTQAISVTTDPAVAVALNDIPFIRNHFFEQEFYDLAQAEVLRGPQGTLYGRNATAGVVNLIPAKPSDQFELMASADGGNYSNRRFEGMINIPVIDDRLDVRLAGEWTKRDGYSFNELTASPIDGRDLWSGRLSIAIKPVESLRATIVWEHFSEDDDRLRSSKQLCKTAPTPAEVGGVPVGTPGGWDHNGGGALPVADFFSQGCQMGSLYSPDAFGVPNAFALPYFLGLSYVGYSSSNVDPYLNNQQSSNLRSIQSSLDQTYKAKNATVELNTDYDIAPGLTLTSQTGYNHDNLRSTEEYNRFNSAPGVFQSAGGVPGDARAPTLVSADGVFCDPQLGCADRIVAEDLSDEHAWQLSQEFRLTSNFSGPFNFSLGGNYLHYETEENYYVFINALTLTAAEPFANHPFPNPWNPAVDDNHECLRSVNGGQANGGFAYPDPNAPSHGALVCGYIDPNPIGSLNDDGHNYFLSQNPYTLNSYAGFGEVYYNVLSDLKMIGGLRWANDRKHFVNIPSELLVEGFGYPSTGSVDQQWNEWTGRFAANWTPKLDFTDQTLIYGSFAHGYKAGGANPPGAVLLSFQNGDIGRPIHPLTFAPEFINAYELGTKNTLLDGALTLNGDVFFYDYKSYQISEIVDRTSINLNFDATVKGAELEMSWEPTPGLKFGFAGGYEATRLADGSQAVDLIDRADAAHHPDWVVVKPFITQASNCIVPDYVAAAAITGGVQNICETLYNLGQSVAGFDPSLPEIHNGAGFNKDLSGNELPNAPHFTLSLSGEYTVPVTSNWAATLHSDFYWQAKSYARVFNDVPYDQIHGYTNVNFAVILTSQNGWQVMGYLKNAFDTTAITGDFLNSDDTGLTTNIFLTDPRLFGARITKNL